MRGYEVYKVFQTLTPKQQDYAIGYFTGGCAMHEEGFTDGHPQGPHAKYALDQLEEAMKQAQIKEPTKG